MLLASRSLRFGDFRFNVSTHELRRIDNDGAATPITLGSRATDLLILFLRRPGELVTKNDILEAVWPNAVVEESNLPVQISALRRALDAGRSGASAIQNVPGRGYRFTLQVAEDDTSTDPPVVAPRSASPESTEPSSDAAAALPEPVSATPLRQPVPAAPIPTHDGIGRAAKWSLFGAAVAVALLCAVVVAVQLRGFSTAGRPAEPVAGRPAPPRLSIAVLPFVNSTGEPKLDDLAAALTEDVTTGLAQIDGSFVVARSMAQATVARQLPLREIGNELGVRYVLEGSTRRSHNGTELRVQLIDAASGASVWADQFQGSPTEPGDLSTQIAQNLMFPLATAFMDAEARRLSNPAAGALTAQDLLLQVRASANQPPPRTLKTSQPSNAHWRSNRCPPRS